MLLAAVFLTSCAEAPKIDENYDVRVILRECKGITIDGDNIIDTKSGRTVTFKVTVDSGYVYLGNTAGAEYVEESGRLRISKVFAPMTVDVIVVPESEVIRLRVEKNEPDGPVSETEVLLAAPGEVTLSAGELTSLKFSGWSEGGYLKDGGSLISTDASHTFYIDQSSTVYANFSGYESYDIIYHLNGGYVRGTSDETYTFHGRFSGLYSMQQTMISDGTFERDGYVAVGYSTSPASYEDFDSANDIPGFSNMGGVCSVTGDSLDLYAVWAKANPERDFDYEIKNISCITDSSFSFGNLSQKRENIYGVEITGYSGGDIAVIPEEIEGLPVLSIASDAFDSDISRVVIPRTVRSVASGAFSGCDNLKEVVIFDSVVSVFDASFPKCVSTVVLNAQHLPVYSGAIEGSFNVKYERLRTVEGKKLIIVAGSSSLNGIDSPLFEELMEGYSVVNYGTNAANPSMFFLDVISKYVGEGDIVVHAPEYGRGAPMGSNEFHPKMFRGNEQCYDIFRDVNMSDYSGFWDSFRKYQLGDPSDSSIVPAIHQSGKEQMLDAQMNKYGDIGTERKSVRGSFGGSNLVLSDAKLYSDNLNYINEKITSAGATLLMSFAPHDKARYNPSVLNQTEYDKVAQYCDDELDYPVISRIETYIMEHSEFFDSEWHLNEEGAKKRTQNLAADIKAYLADPSAY